MDLHTLPKTHGKKKKRLGRGDASGKGSYSGKGIKGQKARSGGKGGLKLRGLKQTFKGIPKSRGFVSPYAKAQAVNIEKLESVVTAGDTITPAYLVEKGLVTSATKPIKILGQGELTKSVTVEGISASKSAIAAIEKAGGTVRATENAPEPKKKKAAKAETKKESGAK